jgi:hypothetical protein
MKLPTFVWIYWTVTKFIYNRLIKTINWYYWVIKSNKTNQIMYKTSFFPTGSKIKWLCYYPDDAVKYHQE